MDIAIPVAHEVSNVSFAFIDSEEVKKMSVRRIFNPTTFDPISNAPTHGGLYDPALGPSDRAQLCETCKLTQAGCPGHFGHIELAVPVYHPLLFKSLYALLRSKCFCCHSLRIKDARVHRFEARIKLANAGLIMESMELEGLDFAERAENTGNIDLSDIIGLIDQFVKEAFEKHNIDSNDTTIKSKVTVTTDYIRRLCKEFLATASNIRKCENCGGASPSLRKEGASKLFQMPFSKKDQAYMDAKGLKPVDTLDDGSAQDMQVDNEEGEGEDEDEKKNPAKFLTPVQVLEQLKHLWSHEVRILDILFGSLKLDPLTKKMVRKSSYLQFFMDAVSVPPTRFRPVSVMGDKQFDHAQNQYLGEIIRFNNTIVELQLEEKEKEKAASAGATQLVAAVTQVEGESTRRVIPNFEKQITNWVSLQESVNNLIDSNLSAKGKKVPPGIKQIMEKKEGLFRKHMMGKRVNYAARSVISPDPMIETSEIGIPMVFAKKLTYPEPVTSFNLQELRQAVINGPDQYPGAVSVQSEDGTMSMLGPYSKEQREAIANQLLTPTANLHSNEDIAHINKKVYRHLKNGDMLLLNRQPTLHKPSIMGHTARILPHEKTIRMHYANCNTYNADFDGDEMNVHFPQNPIAQAEARLIANNDNQYLVPTSGSPLRGLIQDHVVTGVLMSSRGTFLTKEKYIQLIFASVPASADRVLTLPPAIIKPVPLWTGKQCISTVLMNLTKGKKPLNLNSKSQVPGKSWSIMQAHETEEGDVLFVDGELLTGILDKKQFGAKAYGMVHACFEVYGAKIAGLLLTALGRLFTGYVQMIGFTCRMDDLVVLGDADKLRRSKIDEALAQGKEILKEFAFGNEDSATAVQTPIEKKLRHVIKSKKTTEEDKARAEKSLEALEEKRLYKALEDTIRSDEKLAQLDAKMKSKTGVVTSAIVKALLPNGLYRPFPDNGMQLMTVSGAKGSNVNVTQISCMLGQQELEGRRVPVMVSGKTLPSFRAYDLGPRAGGYITGRFLTGIKPQEYYFHCMAGREGLVDTAVKTARSGYLQRCLIKHLEGLKVNYDHTVRDSADGSVYQFHYGEDSLDVTKASYLNKFKFNAMNYAAFLDKYNPGQSVAALNVKKAEKGMNKCLKNPKKYDPVMATLSPSRYLGSTSEKYYREMTSYAEKDPDSLFNDDEADSTSTKPSSQSFEALMLLKYIHSLVEPGEAVGLLAAQSIGEPSTQMTLNTFHFAGHGAANVTLGIPRLREIIMTASPKPKTPLMTVPFLAGISRAAAELVCRKVSRLTLDMIMEEATVSERLLAATSSNMNERSRCYVIRLKFISNAEYKERFDLSSDQIQYAIEKKFVKKLLVAINKDLKNSARRSSQEADEIGQGVDVGRFNEASQVVASTEAAIKSKKGVRSVVEDDEMPEDEMDASAASRAAKRKQHTSYDAPDEEDVQIIKEQHSVSDDEDDMPASSGTVSMDVVDDEELEELVNVDASTLQRRTSIIGDNSFVTDYRFDDRNGEWCELHMQFPADIKKLLMIGMVESVAPSCVISEIPGIAKCHLNEDKDAGKMSMTCEGVNITGIWQFSQFLDICRIETNDVAAILRTYGVEAARRTITNEISGVFAVYGIDVDSRHLSLIADYMTFEGGYKPFNRMGIESSVSPFAKMTFETTFHFLTEATLRGDFDSLESPSARIVMGQVVKGGTGSFEIMQSIQ